MLQRNKKENKYFLHDFLYAYVRSIVALLSPVELESNIAYYLILYNQLA